MFEPNGGIVFSLAIMCGVFFFAGYVFGSTHKRPKVYRFPSTDMVKD
jgi:hypothetical protein